MLGKRESGEGKLGCVIWVAVLAVVALVAWNVIPVKIQSAELYDFALEQAKFAGNLPPEQIKKNIMGKAEELDVPLEKKNLDVRRTRGKILMNWSYTVPLDFVGFKYDYKVERELERDVFLW